MGKYGLQPVDPEKDIQNVITIEILKKYIQFLNIFNIITICPLLEFLHVGKKNPSNLQYEIYPCNTGMKWL